MPTSENFWNKIARKYADSPIKNMEAYEKTMDRVRAHLTNEDSVLEVGCGTGSTALLLAGGVKRYAASDISSEMIAIANEKAADQSAQNVEFIHSEMFGDAHDKGPFDAVLAFNFLHLVEDVPGAVRKIHGMLRPGGLFISKTVCLGERSWLLRPLIKLMQMVGKAPFVAILTNDDMDRMIADGGFEVLETGLYPAPSSRFVVAKKV